MSDQSNDQTVQHDPTQQHDPSADQVAGDVQEQVDEAAEKGYVGVKADPRPNTDYSMEGGAPGKTGQPGAPDGGPSTEENQ